MHGAVIAGGNYFVVTPYNDYVATPPLGTQRIRIRSDGRYGEHDWTVWPQVFSEPLCHFACIPRPGPADSPWDPLWLVPLANEFEAETTTTVIGSLGKLNRSTFREIATTVEIVLQQSAQFSSKYLNATESKLAMQLSSAIRLWLHRLEFLTTTFRQMVNNCATLQRLSLELIGLMDYYEKYKPIMMGVVPSPSTHASELMGAFVTSLQDAERLFQARIPFWFVHPLRHLLCIRVNNLTPLSSAEAGPDIPGSTVLYEGPADLVVQYKAIIKHCRYMGSSNVFRESVEPRSLHAQMSAETGPIRNKRKKGKPLCRSTVSCIYFN